MAREGEELHHPCVDDPYLPHHRLPVSTLRKHNEDRHEGHLDGLLDADFRFQSIRANYAKMQAELEKMKKAGAPPEKIEEARKKMHEIALKDVEKIERSMKRIGKRRANSLSATPPLRGKSGRRIDRERVKVLWLRRSSEKSPGLDCRT